jgi:hypothetical protein
MRPCIGSRAGRRSEGFTRRRGEVTRAGFALTVDAGARTEVVVTGVLRLKPRSIPGSYLVPAVWSRHLWMHRTRPHREFDLDYLLGPLRTWARVGPIDVTVDVPSSWSLEGATMAADARRDESSGRRPLGFVLETVDGRTRARGRTSVDAGAILTVRMTHPASGVHHGGPFLGIGGAPGADGGFRTRLGYEVAAPSFLLYSLTADTDWNTRVVVTPMVELASPWMFIVPSFGLGVGLPVRVTPDVMVGARIQGSMHLGPLGFVTTVDLYPTLLRAGSPGGSQVSLYASWSM